MTNIEINRELPKKIAMENIEEMKALYQKYYVDREFERENVFVALKELFNVESAIYPGSYVHITPSFVFPKTAYVDNDSKAKKFFSNIENVKNLINSRKFYNEEVDIEFFGHSYHKSLQLEEGSFDLLFSHYAGVISQPCKKYLKIGGHLLVNNSHADAGVAYLDPDFKLVAVIEPNRKDVISTKRLNEYFIPKKGVHLGMEELIQKGSGIGYKRTASLYLFERIK